MLLQVHFFRLIASQSGLEKRNQIPFTYFQVRIAKQLGGYDILNKLLEYHYSATIYHVALQHNILLQNISCRWNTFSIISTLT